ncbi:MAG: hypothetical protein IIA06_08850 [Proteobacteria bacterium]|nr:hypothetical protein [Pseudomonadota bacterium]
MTDKQTEQNDRDEEGKFLPGNSLWSLRAWKPGNAGRPILYTPKEFCNKVIQFIEDRQNIKKTLTMSGLRGYLGLSASGLRAYEQGEIGKTDKDKGDYIYILDQFRAYMEDEAESKLDRERGSIEGIKYRLNNMFSERWRDSKHISVDTNEGRTIKIFVDSDSPLTQRLAQAGCDIQVIEHTSKG